jgi:hypothetical protein
MNERSFIVKSGKKGDGWSEKGAASGRLDVVALSPSLTLPRLSAGAGHLLNVGKTAAGHWKARPLLHPRYGLNVVRMFFLSRGLAGTRAGREALFVNVVMERCSEGFGQRFGSRGKLPDRQDGRQNENRVNPGLEQVVALFFLLLSREQCVGRLFSLSHNIDVRHRPGRSVRWNAIFAL